MVRSQTPLVDDQCTLAGIPSAEGASNYPKVVTKLVPEGAGMFAIGAISLFGNCSQVHLPGQKPGREACLVDALCFRQQCCFHCLLRLGRVAARERTKAASRRCRTNDPSVRPSSRPKFKGRESASSKCSSSSPATPMVSLKSSRRNRLTRCKPGCSRQHRHSPAVDGVSGSSCR